MLAFLRKIRRTLIGTGNSRKYLWYAIGEIALVVIGILIALYINTLNEHRKDRVAEKYYLQQIIKDLQEDSISLNASKAEFNYKIPLIRNLVKQLNEENNRDAYKTAIIEYLDVLDPLYWESNNPSFDEMVSSGKLGLIRNTELRNQIQKLYDELKQASNYFRNMDEYQKPVDNDILYHKGIVRYVEDIEDLFGPYITDEEIYQSKQHKEAL